MLLKNQTPADIAKMEELYQAINRQVYSMSLEDYTRLKQNPPKELKVLVPKRN